jgi:polyhydroxyalkanoate synthesis regulator phasin
MPDKPLSSSDPTAGGETPAAAPTPPVPPRRSPGHRGADVRDTVAEMAAKAQEISQEAGSKMAAAMKDVINAAAGIAGFAVESARDLVQYMVRRGQMTQEEADKLIREAEAAQVGRAPMPPRPAPPKAAAPAAATPASPAPMETARPAMPLPPRAPAAPVAPPAPPARPAAAPAPAARKAAPPPPKAAAKKAPPAKKAVAKPAAKAAAKKGSAKTAKKR